MKKALFIDRDGTIIKEPPLDFQVDSLEKFEFVPGAISALRTLSGLGFDMVLATNQDGLGTDSFPIEQFEPPHRLMLSTLSGEGVTFDDQLIDRTFEVDKAPTRKPRTGMFGQYLSGDYDLAASYVIGDRLTDVELARNLGARAILLAEKESGSALVEKAGLADVCVFVSDSWGDIAEYIRRGERRVTVSRATRETDITVTIDLDSTGSQIDTGLKFFDHMLAQIAHHGNIMLSVKAKGDLEVDEHHTIEDVGIVLGEAIDKALGSKAGIGRYGFALPMDDCRTLVLLDFGGRIDFSWNVIFTREYIGDTPTEMLPHFFQSLCAAARCNLQISATGDNNHHKAEAIFKAFARALRMAITRSPFGYDIPSSKGII